MAVRHVDGHRLGNQAGFESADRFTDEGVELVFSLGFGGDSDEGRYTEVDAGFFGFRVSGEIESAVEVGGVQEEPEVTADDFVERCWGERVGRGGFGKLGRVVVAEAVEQGWE